MLYPVSSLLCTGRFPFPWKRSRRSMMTIDTLTDDALLEIFSFYLGEPSERIETEPWYTLVHVCRRWRSVVFESPRHLDVQLHYTPNRQVKVMLDIWPTLPIHISADGYKSARWDSEDNLIAALEHTDRICQIQMKGFSCSKLENILTAMQKPFPALTSLDIGCSLFFPGAMAVIPQAFLGGSARHLQSCKFSGVEFPGIWPLLLTANHLVTLRLWDSPHSMRTSPEEMVTYLSTMPNLESLFIGFRSSQSPPDWPDQPNRHQPPLTRIVLPSLTKFHFLVTSEYIEDFVSRIDAPLLDKVDITFFDQPIFHTPQLHDFLARKEKFKAHCRGAMVFCSSSIQLELGPFSLRILCEGPGRQVSSMAQFCSSSLYLPSTLKCLDIRRVYPLISNRQHEVADTQWLDILRLFTGLKDLHIGEGLTLHYALALQELAGQRLTEVLPALQNLFIEKLEPSRLEQELIGQFVAVRQLLGLPVAVHNWDRQS